ncbi:M48 family metalloprotease [Rhodoplanes serenus]|uniref:Protease HtpX homolog n=1 Tax=Rhodoplanes serenus TaxID=200615 RepID=A0A9X4XM63_9BRAD|nr:M48 family metallopeptidase [Rhodoplanes serenus]MTW16734.1 M48 family metalloprotease [Rhodoplanes serenus]
MAYGLYSHIQSNRRRSVVLLIGLFGLVYVLVFAGALAGEALTVDASLPWLLAKARSDFLVAAPFATVATALWIAIAWRFHQAMIDAVTGGRDVTRKDEPRLYNLLENLCISRGIPMPKLKIVDSDALNAFATGLNEKQYAVSVTTGLLARLDDAEIEAVLGHELTHIRNGDVRLMVIAVIIAGVISFVAELVFRVGLNTRWSSSRSGSGDGGGDRGKGGGGAAILIAVVLVAVAWLLSSLIRFALSRSREFLADAGAVELTKNPDAMITALRKIEGRGELPGATSAVMELCVDNPRSGFADLFATHPSIDDRAAALVKFAGGRDPGPLALPDPEDGPAGELPAPDASRPDGSGSLPGPGAESRHGPWGDAPGPEAGPPPSPPAGSPLPWPGQPPGPADGGRPPFPFPGPWGPRR